MIGGFSGLYSDSCSNRLEKMGVSPDEATQDLEQLVVRADPPPTQRWLNEKLQRDIISHTQLPYYLRGYGGNADFTEDSRLTKKEVAWIEKNHDKTMSLCELVGGIALWTFGCLAALFIISKNLQDF